MMQREAHACLPADLLAHTGVHTRKLYHIAQRLPAWVRMLLPGIKLDLEEEAWTLGPHGEITLVRRNEAAMRGFVWLRSLMEG